MTTMETELILLEQIQNLVDADAKASDNTAAVSADNSRKLPLALPTTAIMKSLFSSAL